MDNLNIREFSQSIINFINQSPLLIEIKRLCINEIAAQLQTAAEAQLRDELRERDKQTDREEEQDEPEKDS